MTVELRALTAADAAEHCAGEDEATVRWLTGTPGTVEGTARYFEQLARNARDGLGKRGFGVVLDGRLAGYVDVDPDPEPRRGDRPDGVAVGPGDVSIAYAVHPWARGRGVAVEAVRLVCDVARTQALGSRAVLQVEPENVASMRVAAKAGFRRVGDVRGDEGRTYALHVLEL